jgi:hypothetical protein
MSFCLGCLLYVSLYGVLSQSIVIESGGDGELDIQTHDKRCPSRASDSRRPCSCLYQFRGYLTTVVVVVMESELSISFGWSIRLGSEVLSYLSDEQTDRQAECSVRTGGGDATNEQNIRLWIIVGQR